MAGDGSQAMDTHVTGPADDESRIETLKTLPPYCIPYDAHHPYNNTATVRGCPSVLFFFFFNFPTHLISNMLRLLHAGR
jgi:hypothetical protein